jgi:hypothetical protein
MAADAVELTVDKEKRVCDACHVATKPSGFLPDKRPVQ